MKKTRLSIFLAFTAITIFIILKTDFDVVDLYYLKMKSDYFLSDKKNYDYNTEIDEIVLVNYLHLSRKEIANLVKILEKGKPKVIGIHAFFEGEKEKGEDSLFQEMLFKYDNIVLESHLEYDENNVVRLELPFFDTTTYQYGFNNLVTVDVPQDGTMATDAIHYYESEELVKQYSFVSKIVSKYDYNKFNALVSRGKDEDEIFFYGNIYSFQYLSGTKELMTQENSIDLEGKIVLLGYLGDFFGDTSSNENVYYSPLNSDHFEKPDMFGVVVMANILKMILDGKYIERAGLSLLLVIVFFIVGINSIIFLFLLGRWSEKKRYFFISIFLLTIECIISIILSYYLFSNNRYILPLKEMILSFLVSYLFIEGFRLIKSKTNSTLPLRS
ncbi:MAG: hypothetical protein CMO01_02125 [Thalassobius sp.]|nr:hypothetical protein [Thalassovita sp.]